MYISVLFLNSNRDSMHQVFYKIFKSNTTAVATHIIWLSCIQNHRLVEPLQIFCKCLCNVLCYVKYYIKYNSTLQCSFTSWSLVFIFLFHILQDHNHYTECDLLILFNAQSTLTRAVEIMISLPLDFFLMSSHAQILFCCLALHNV